MALEDSTFEHPAFEKSSEALRDAAQEVLESMFFVSAEDAAGPPAEEDLKILAQVEFRGQWAGRCMVEMPETLARTLTGNFTGNPDADQMDPEVMIETLCEFANMVCGSTITRMGCPGIVALSLPHLIEEWPSPPEQAHIAERWLDGGEGVVHVRMDAEAAG